MIQKRFFLLTLLLLVAVFWFYLHESARLGADMKGKQAPDFTLKNEKGESVHLKDFRGKVVLVHFWATWCPPCAGEIPSLNQFIQKYASQNVVLLAVSEDEEGWPIINKFRKRVPFKFDVLLDDDSVSDRYGTFGLPETYLLNQDGMIVRKAVGPQDWNGPSWSAEINRLLQGS